MSHNHNLEITNENQKKTAVVIILTFVTMLAEILCGYITNSMALLADGFHMGTHVLALSLTYAAYILMNKFTNSEFFPNGTEKIGTLAGFTSSIFLGLTAVWIIIEAFSRLIAPVGIQFGEAIIIALIGLIVNLICIMVMGTKSCSHFENEPFCDSCSKHNTDYNFISAYYHILADILTSLLAIGALIGCKYLNVTYLDPIVGMLGGLLILKWAISLITETTKILIDYNR